MLKRWFERGSAVLVGGLSLFSSIVAFTQDTTAATTPASFDLVPTGRFLVRLEAREGRTIDDAVVNKITKTLDNLNREGLEKIKDARVVLQNPPQGHGDRVIDAEPNIPPYIWVLTHYSISTGASATVAQAWNQAYTIYEKLSSEVELSQRFTFFVEPDFRMSGVAVAAGSCSSSPPDQLCHRRQFKCSLPASRTVDLRIDALPSCEWPPRASDEEIAFLLNWPLERSGLLKARDSVPWRPQESATVIAILDTGYFADHPSLPKHLIEKWAWSFIDGNWSKDKGALDPGKKSYCGHGTATMALLAARPVDVCETNQIIKGVSLGAAPDAPILPIRIADSVIHLWTSSMAVGIAYTSWLTFLENSSEHSPVPRPSVVSISMGGVASRIWADAVNLAYHRGIVIVAAGGNNIGGFPTRNLVYPARFNRTIAAVGVTYDQKAYEASSPEKGVMQGNFGPVAVMGNALSAYTPNTPWVNRRNDVNVLDLDGAGTSSATPQIAAAAAHVFENCAEYLAMHFGSDERDLWKRAQFVREALFSTSGKDLNNGDLVHQKFGRGRLNAFDAISFCKPGKVPSLTRAPIDSVDWPFFRILFGLAEQNSMVVVEALQSLHQASPDLQDQIAHAEERCANDNCADAEEDVAKWKKKLCELLEKNSSERLQNLLRSSQPTC